MSAQFYAGAYWGARQEAAGACAHRLLTCLGDLAALDGALTGWRRTGSSPKSAMASPVGTDFASLGALVASGRNRRDAGMTVIEELGFSVSLWNGDTRRPIGLQMTCGAFAPRTSNLFTLQLPDELCSWLPWAKARRLMEILVSSFEPEWATLTSHEWRRLQVAAPGRPVVGWLTYLTDASATERTAGASAEPFAGGVLISAGTECDESLGQRVHGVAASLGRGPRS